MNFFALLLTTSEGDFDFAAVVECLQAQEELFVVVKEKPTEEKDRSLAPVALVCLRMGLRVALTSAPARSAKMRTHQVGCEKIWCASRKREVIVTCLAYNSLMSISLILDETTVHFTLHLAPSTSHAPSPTSRVSPDISRESLTIENRVHVRPPSDTTHGT